MEERERHFWPVTGSASGPVNAAQVASIGVLGTTCRLWIFTALTGSVLLFSYDSGLRVPLPWTLATTVGSEPAP